MSEQRERAKFVDHSPGDEGGPQLAGGCNPSRLGGPWLALFYLFYLALIGFAVAMVYVAAT